VGQQQVQEALKSRLKESQQRIMSAVDSHDEQLIDRADVDQILENELLMLMSFGERLIQLGATTGKEVKYEH